MTAQSGASHLQSSGPLVFLFSDIEGSTARWESNAAAMSAALRRHDETLHRAMADRGGRVFKTVGDAFCVVFSSPADAVAAAVDAQRALAREDFRDVDGLAVRMALHAGAAEEREGDYFGPAVNRVARLLSTAHGGQIVTSAALADLCAQGLPDGIALLPLGTFRLKDLERPEPICQVLADGLERAFKPLNTLDAVPNNLPLQTSAFVGRSSDVGAIRAALRKTTLLTIVGPGGVGKTRLALQCAADRTDRMTDGVWFVNLAPLTDAGLVSRTILSTVGGTAVESDDALAPLVEFLKTRTALLVLDNCEHLIDEAARCVAAIHEQCPHVTILATSRERLHVDGEQVYHLQPLDTQDALSLFVQRAKAASARFELTAENREPVEAICAHLDGIPLAIELAAARVHALSPHDLLHRLDQRFRLLKSGGRTAQPRQQTLEALIDWSHDLLTDSEKTLFRRLAVFRGSFTLEAACATCADDVLDEWTIVDLLTSLADKSLLAADVHGARPRYHLLETIREYAWSKLQTDGSPHARYHLLESIRDYASIKLQEAGEAAQLRLCHAEYFARVAAQAYRDFDTRPPENWLSELAFDLNNFRAALEWTLASDGTHALAVQLAGDIAPLFLRLSLLDEGAEWCNRAIAVEGDAPPAARARVRYVLSMIYNNQANLQAALSAVARAVELFGGTSDERGTTRALSQLAQQLARAERFDEAKAASNDAVARARSIGDARLSASVLRRCAFALPPSEIELAREGFQEALHAAQRLDDGEEVCLIRQWWAASEAAAQEYERAMDISILALECADRDTRMYLCGDIAGYAIVLGRFEEAASFAREALTLALDANHELNAEVAIAYSTIEWLAIDPVAAVQLLGFALARLGERQYTGHGSGRAAIDAVSRIARNAFAGDYDATLTQGMKFARNAAIELVRRLNTSALQTSAVPAGS